MSDAPDVPQNSEYPRVLVRGFTRRRGIKRGSAVGDNPYIRHATYGGLAYCMENPVDLCEILSCDPIG